MSIPSFDLTVKVALITGTSRGIGLAFAEAFAVAGAKVVLHSREQEALEVESELKDGLSMIGTKLQPASVLFMGWFG